MLLNRSSDMLSIYELQIKTKFSPSKLAIIKIFVRCNIEERNNYSNPNW